MYYCVQMSTASSPLADHDLMNIKAKLKTDCQKLGITGLLVFHRNTFIHYYEGEKTNVGKLVTILGKDKRHKAVNAIGEGKLRSRQFDGSSMELRVLDKDPLFTPDELADDGAGVKRLINDKFLSIT